MRIHSKGIIPRNLYLAWLIVLPAILAAGCRHKSAPPVVNHFYGYFKTPFQTESRFIVDSIVSDLAEQMYYAHFHRLPSPEHVLVTSREKNGSPRNAPVYEIKIFLHTNQPPLQADIDVNGPIWSPAIYQAVTKQLADAVGMAPDNPVHSNDTSLLAKLTDGTAETIEVQNEEISQSLEDHFTDSELHEQAALLLGAFIMRDHSGNFFEIRSPLCRLTAHLAMAHYLGNGNDYGINGQVADAMLLTLIGDEVPALQQLNTISTNDPAVAAFVRALRARNTGDFRPMNKMNGLSRVEAVEWFLAMANNVGLTEAWPKLSAVQQQTIDFVRVADQEKYSVEIGHDLAQEAIPLELQEISQVYELSHNSKLPQDGLVNALNAMPEHCFSVGANGTPRVNVIGWGQWADFFQRELCHAVQQNFWFYQYYLGASDYAAQFAEKCGGEFGGLRLYPFVERIDATNVASYHKSVDEGIKVTVETPQLVPSTCWDWLFFLFDSAPRYIPVPNPHVNEWHYPNPPPGTAYDLYQRFADPSLTDQPDAMDVIEKLHQLAPWNSDITTYILRKKYNNRPTYEQAMALYSNMVPYNVTAMRMVANSVYDDPNRYEIIMLQAAELNPAFYYTLGDYFAERQNDDKAAGYYEQAAEMDSDSVRVSNYAVWRVEYYLERGKTEKARQVAEAGGEVYSYRGLQAEATFFEMTSNYDEAFDWYSKIEDRYDDYTPLLNFCLRYKTRTGDTRFDSAVQQTLAKLFPKGIEKVTVGDFSGPPDDGVLIEQANDRIKAAGLAKGDVIVAVYGMRVHNMNQYVYGRQTRSTPELDLIVWHNGAYQEFSPSVPGHLFGVSFGDYIRK